MYVTILLPPKFKNHEDVLLGAGWIKNSLVLHKFHNTSAFLLGFKFRKSPRASFGLELYLGFWFVSISM